MLLQLPLYFLMHSCCNLIFSSKVCLPSQEVESAAGLSSRMKGAGGVGGGWQDQGQSTGPPPPPGGQSKHKLCPKSLPCSLFHYFLFIKHLIVYSLLSIVNHIILCVVSQYLKKSIYKIQHIVLWDCSIVWKFWGLTTYHEFYTQFRHSNKNSGQ